MISKLSYFITDNTIPYKNLALEEYLTLHVEEEECILFLWQNRHTVVIGKNQNAWKECKVNYLEEDDGYLVRRLSGGGAVFHDLGNLNFTFCAQRNNYDVKKQLAVIVEAVNALGITAKMTGRNDITINGRKFSGNAFYEKKGYCYHHGTILLDIDKKNMSKYLNVSKEKLKSKGVDSVKSRVMNISECYKDITVSLMEEKLIEAFSEVYGRTAQVFPKERLDEKQIEDRKNMFSSWEWKYGKKIPFTYQMSRRFLWGDIDLQFAVNQGIIIDVNAFSDAMEQDVIAAIPPVLVHCKYEETALIKALSMLENPNGKEIITDIIQLVKEQL